MSNSIIARERLWLTADKSRAVKDGDPEARFLLCAPGQQISKADAERYGLLAKEAKPEPPEASGVEVDPASPIPGTIEEAEGEPVEPIGVIPIDPSLATKPLKAQKRQGRKGKAK